MLNILHVSIVMVIKKFDLFMFNTTVFTLSSVCSTAVRNNMYAIKSAKHKFTTSTERRDFKYLQVSNKVNNNI